MFPNKHYADKTYSFFKVFIQNIPFSVQIDTVNRFLCCFILIITVCLQPGVSISAFQSEQHLFLSVAYPYALHHRYVVVLVWFKWHSVATVVSSHCQTAGSPKCRLSGLLWTISLLFFYNPAYLQPHINKARTTRLQKSEHFLSITYYSKTCHIIGQRGERAVYREFWLVVYLKWAEFQCDDLFLWFFSHV